MTQWHPREEYLYTWHNATLRHLLIILILNQSKDHNWGKREHYKWQKLISILPSSHPSMHPSFHQVCSYIAATWNRIKATSSQSSSITRISSGIGFVVLRGCLFVPLSFTHHSCRFISGAELNTAGWRHVQPQLQIDRLSSPVASASFSPSAQQVFIHSYCSYERISETYLADYL